MAAHRLSPSDIIEEIVDELAMGSLGEAVPAFELRRTAPGTLFLDYGDAGRFVLTVVEQSDVA